MSYLLVAAAFTIAPQTAATYSSVESAAEVLANDVQTGTLLISKGDCLAIRVFSRSPYTHVAAVVVENGRAWVYDSQNGDGVRRQTLDEYLDAEQPDVLYVLHPRRKFSSRRSRLFTEHLESQLGRPYDVMHHLTGKRAEGLHCAEYLTDALMQCHLIRAQRPARVSPASLAEGVLKHDLYVAAARINVSPPVDHPVGRNRCEQLWIDTKVCARNCCEKLQGWFLCR